MRCLLRSRGKQLPGEGGGELRVPEADDVQLLPGPGHGHVEEPPLLLGIVGAEAGGAAAGVPGKDAVGHVHQDHPVVFQALAGVDGGENDRGFVAAAGPGQRLQLGQTGQQPENGRLGRAEDFENGGLIGVQAAALQVVAVAHKVDDAVDGPVGGVAPHIAEMGRQRPDSAPGVARQGGQVRQQVQYRLARAAALGGGQLGGLPGDPGIHFIV